MERRAPTEPTKALHSPASQTRSRPRKTWNSAFKSWSRRMPQEMDMKTSAPPSGALYARLTRGPGVSTTERLESASDATAPLDDARIKQSIGLLNKALGRTKTRFRGSTELADRVT